MIQTLDLLIVGNLIKTKKKKKVRQTKSNSNYFENLRRKMGTDQIILNQNKANYYVEMLKNNNFTRLEDNNFTRLEDKRRLN